VSGDDVVDVIARTPPIIQLIACEEGAMYNALRSTLLMLDLLPENADRFGLTYTKCAAVGT